MQKIYFSILFSVFFSSLVSAVSVAQCPTGFVVEPAGWWYETESPFSETGRVTIEVTFRNVNLAKKTLTFNSDELIQVWIGEEPNLVVPKLEVISMPDKPVRYGKTFSYKFSFNVKDAEDTTRIIGIRPVTHELGTTQPAAVTIVKQNILCK